MTSLAFASTAYGISVIFFAINLIYKLIFVTRVVNRESKVEDGLALVRLWFKIKEYLEIAFLVIVEVVLVTRYFILGTDLLRYLFSGMILFLSIDSIIGTYLYSRIWNTKFLDKEVDTTSTTNDKLR